MIVARAISINVVEIVGMDTRHVSMLRWRRALERMAAQIQGQIYSSYRRERNAFGQRFKPNTPQWNARKARKGWAPERGQMLRRIVNTLRREPMFTVSAIVGGRAVITFDELRLIARWQHAYYYGTAKVPGGRILQVNPVWLPNAARWLRALATEAQIEESRKLEQRASITGPDTVSIPAAGRRVLTLAATAWRAARDTALRLRRL